MAPRFTVSYYVRAADEAEARARALDIALEQTVEIPRDVVPKGYVEDEILGKLEALAQDPVGRPGYLATISYSEDDVGGDFLQFLNIVFGNSSIKPGLKVEGIGLSKGILALCHGPRHGIAGLRQKAGIGAQPLLMSAIKPVGLSTSELARRAHDFALGGMHFVKDDHGLVDQRTSPFAAATGGLRRRCRRSQCQEWRAERVSCRTSPRRQKSCSNGRRWRKKPAPAPS